MAWPSSKMCQLRLIFLRRYFTSATIAGRRLADKTGGHVPFGQFRPFVTVRDLLALATCYAEIKGRHRPKPDAQRRGGRLADACSVRAEKAGIKDEFAQRLVFRLRSFRLGPHMLSGLGIAIRIGQVSTLLEQEDALLNCADGVP